MKKLHELLTKFHIKQLRAAFQIVQIILGENFTKQLRSIHLSNVIVARRIGNTSEDMQNHLLSKLRKKLSSIKRDETKDNNKDCSLIAYDFVVSV